jgi:hypothetical protein
VEKAVSELDRAALLEAATLVHYKFDPPFQVLSDSEVTSEDKAHLA